MAATELQKSLLGMSISLFDAAPGAVFLKLFEEMYSSADSNILTVAELLTKETVFKGIYADSLSNIDFATAYIERLVGNEAQVEAKDWAIKWVSGQMDLGASRAEVMLIAAETLRNMDPNDAVWGKAQQALVNQIAAAEYYSVETGQSSNDIKLLQGAIAGTTSDASTIPNTPLKLLIANHAQAIKARDEFLSSADGDDNTATSATLKMLTAKLNSAFSSVDGLVEGEYAKQTAVVKAALLKDQQAVNTELETFYKKSVVTATEALDAITGLKAALETRNTDEAAYKEEQKVVVSTNTTLLDALSDYGTKNNVAPTINTDGTVTGLIVLNSGNLALAAGVTEATHSGIDALLAASVAKEAADEKVLVSKPKAEESAATVDNLDLTTVAKVELAVLGGKFSKNTPANAATPTTAEINKEVADLATDKVTSAALVTAYTAASVLANTADAVIDNTSNSTTNLVAIKSAFNGAADIDAADQARVTGTTTDATALAEIAVIVAEKTAAANTALTAQTNFAAAKTSYDTAADTNPLVAALAKAQEKEVAATKAITDLTAAIDQQKSAQEAIDQLTILNNAVDVAAKSFIQIGLTVPEVISGAIAGTDENDIWLAGSSDATISDFANKDSLYLGTGYTLNKSTIAGEGSADSLLDMWLTDDNGNTLMTFESSMTGGSALPQETFAITLTGVALVNVQLVDGFVSLV